MKENNSNTGGVPEGGSKQANTEDSTSTVDQITSILKGAKDNFQKIIEVASKIDDLLVKATGAQAKADNEALRANQAKVMVEEHSNTVAKLKGSLEADVSAIAAKKTEIENIAQVFSNLRASSEADAINIVNARKTANEGVKAIAETSGKATATQANLEEIKKNVDLLSQAILEERKEVESNSAESAAASVESKTILSEMTKAIAAINETQERIKTTHGVIEAFEKEAKTKLESINSFIKKSAEMEGRVATYEASLVAMEKDFQTVRDKVEVLLPGAASASLASSFCAQKKRFKVPQIAWMVSFVGCIGLLLYIAGQGKLSDLATEPATWDAIFRHLVQRLPYVIPLVWLGIYSGRQYMSSLRMEEEYAFKEATSTAFEGYKREMASIPESTNGHEAPINTLCDNVLTSLSRRPGLIYEGKHQDVTPLTPVVEALEKIIPPAIQAVLNKELPKSPSNS